MVHLGGKGPLGLKPDKKPKEPRKGLPRQSEKRKAYMASQERVEGLAHMAEVAQEGCIVCGARPVEVHHATKPRNDKEVLPLCPLHHRREFGPGAIHYSPKAFHAEHGTVKELLARVDEAIKRHASRSAPLGP